MDALEELARKLLDEPEYRQRALQVSEQMRARKNPSEVAAEAIERLMTLGGHHLRSNAAYSLNFVQFYMLDVLLALFLMLLIIMLLAGCCLLRCLSFAARSIIGSIHKSKNKHKVE